MKQTLLVISLISILSLTFAENAKSQNGQPVVERNPDATPGKNGDMLYDRACPKAKTLLTDSFFWSQDELTSPFGCAGGMQTALFYIKWRDTSKTASAVMLLEHSYTASLYPPFDWHETDAHKIQIYLNSLMHSTLHFVQNERKLNEELVKEQGGDKLSKSAYDAEVQKYMNVSGLCQGKNW